MVVRSRYLQLYLFYFACGLMFLSVVLVISKDSDNEIIKHLDKEAKESSEQKKVTSTPPKQKKVKALDTLEDLKQEAISSLSSCSCVPHHRSTWLAGVGGGGVIVPNILHIVRYGDTPLSYVECVSIKSVLLHMNPDKLYLHTNLVDLSNYGQYWNRLYSDKTLNLDERLRVFMARDPGEMNILGKTVVSPHTASVYWKFHVLNKYGGVLVDTNILLLQDINSLRHLDLSTIVFENKTFSLNSGVLLSASTSSPLVKDILEIAKNATEETFIGVIEKVIREDEVSAGKFLNKDPGMNLTTGETDGMLALRLEGEILSKAEEDVKDSEDFLAKILYNIWNRNGTDLGS